MEFEENDEKIEIKIFAIYFSTLFSAKFILLSQMKMCFLRGYYIAIDEFQQIIEYPEKGVEALLRSYIQFAENVKFIFQAVKNI